MSEMEGLVEEAMAALVRMDADKLGSLEVRALELGDNLAGVPTAELTARLRVLAGVLEGTRRSIEVLYRVRGYEDRGEYRGRLENVEHKEQAWAR